MNDLHDRVFRSEAERQRDWQRRHEVQRQIVCVAEQARAATRSAIAFDDVEAETIVIHRLQTEHERGQHC